MNPATAIPSDTPVLAVAATEMAAAPPVGERRFSVLLVDDSPIVCERLTALILQLHRSIQVAVSQDGTRAQEEFVLLRPDAVVLDLELPGASGFDLIAQFKLRHPACVVIVLTTYAYPEFRENALRLGADYFFSKTMEFERVTDVLSGLVASPPFAP
jgi:DNA-binding NarL/FixJ family response regulator